MLIKLIEVYSEANHSAKSTENVRKFHLREVVINSQYVVTMREDAHLEYYLEKDLLPEGLDKKQKFTTISIMRGQIGNDIPVVGSLETIMKMFNGDSRGLVKG